jgi:hypothetical protein
VTFCAFLWLSSDFRRGFSYSVRPAALPRSRFDNLVLENSCRWPMVTLLAKTPPWTEAGQRIVR